MSRITAGGASGVPPAVAGQTAVQRSHLVHEKVSRTCFQVRSASEATPTLPLGRGIKLCRRSGLVGG